MSEKGISFVIKIVLIVLAVVVLGVLISQYGSTQQTSSSSASSTGASAAAAAAITATSAASSTAAAKRYESAGASCGFQPMEPFLNSAAPYVDAESSRFVEAVNNVHTTVKAPVVSHKPAIATTDDNNAEVAPSSSYDTQCDSWKSVNFESEDFPSNVPTSASATVCDKAITKVEDLLPKDAENSKWAQVNPMGKGDVKDQNYLTAGYYMGVNTVGQTLRNPNLQLRSDPYIPKQENISIWNIGTIDYDDSRRYFEIGCV